MKLEIPKKIKSSLQDIANVSIELHNSKAGVGEQSTTSINAPKEHIALYDWLDVLDAFWKKSTSFNYKIVYIDGETETIQGSLDDTLQNKINNVQASATKDIAGLNSFCFEKIKDIPAYVISMDKDRPRYERAAQELEKLGFSSVQRWGAFDPKVSDPGEALYRYGIVSTDFFKNAGEIGCTLSHLQLYEDLLNSSDEYRLVFEDDVVAHSKFHELIASVKGLSLDSFDVLFLGGWFWSWNAIDDLRRAVEASKDKTFLRNPTSFETHAMLITRKFAYKAVEGINRQQALNKGLIIDNYITFSKYFETCLLTFSPFDSENISKLQIRNTNTCGLFLQTNMYTSQIQTNKKIFGIKEVSHKEAGGVWTKSESEEEYDFSKYSFFGETALNKSYVMPETGILALENAFIDMDGLTHNSEGAAVLSISWFEDIRSRDILKWVSAFKRHKLDKFSIESSEHKAGSALNLCAAWSIFNPGHFQMDVLGMLGLVKASSSVDLNDFDYICVPANDIILKKDLLRKLNIPESKIINIDGSQVYSFDFLATPSLNGAACRYRRGAFDYARELFGCSKEKQGNRLLYVAREDSGRDIHNLEEVEDMLHELGFQKIRTKSLKNYVKLFSEASVVVGAHGAGLANCMFCPSSATLVELIPDFHQYPYYMSLADSVGMNYTGLICADARVDLPSKTYTVSGNKRILVDVKLLKGTIDVIQQQY